MIFIVVQQEQWEADCSWVGDLEAGEMPSEFHKDDTSLICRPPFQITNSPLGQNCEVQALSSERKSGEGVSAQAAH